MVKFQVYMENGKALFTDDFEVEDVSFEGSVVYAEVGNLGDKFSTRIVDFNNWKRTYRDYRFEYGKRKLKAVTIFY